MALSIAHDGDLAFQKRDLTRFWPLYESGPEGIFLKRGKGPEDRLYFGKSFIYPLVAAPFVRFAGLNGLLLLNVLLLAGMFVCLYLYAAARMASSGALLTSTGFLGASITPLFGVWMMPETFNLALVGVGYFFWLYKEVRPRHHGASAAPRDEHGTDIVAAVLLGLATFSKPSNLVLILPPIALAWWRGQWGRGLTTGVVFGLVVAAGFGANGLISGELNYQGGERKTFYGQYPFQNDNATFDNLGISVTTESPRVRRVATSRPEHGVLPLRAPLRAGPVLLPRGRCHGVGRHAATGARGLARLHRRSRDVNRPGAAAVAAQHLVRRRRSAWQTATFSASIRRCFS